MNDNWKGERIGHKNAWVKNSCMLISYNTPVAYYGLDGLFKTAGQYSVTTRKHINDWFRKLGMDPTKIEVRSQKWFDDKLELCLRKEKQ